MSALQLPCQLTDTVELVDWDDDRGDVCIAVVRTRFAPTATGDEIKRELALLVEFITDQSDTRPPPACYRGSSNRGTLYESRALLQPPRNLVVRKVHWAGPTVVFISGLPA